jgi:hypothetical protein
MPISKLAAGLGFSEADIKVFDDLDSKEQRATTRLGINEDTCLL